MQFAARTARRPSENIVPLINVVFLLLVFFMLTGTLSPSQPIDVDLPTSPGSARPDSAHPDSAASHLLVSQGGALVLDGDSVSPDELVARLGKHLRKRLGERPGALEVRADAGLSARILLPLLERLQQAGLSRVDLVTQREP